MNEVTVYDSVSNALKPADLKAQVNLIQEVMRDVMHDGEHFGTIPGCGNKPTLLKAGAEKLIMTFRLVPDIEEQVFEMPNGHREYRVKVRMYSQSQIYLGSGVGACTTMEGKFRFRKAELVCPDCGVASIIKGKAEFGGGWICYAKKGGCGKKWTDSDNPFDGISTDKIEHDNPADYYNTCLKMAKKRALVDALLTVTAASDIFTQDIEDMPEVITPATPKPEKSVNMPQSKSKTAPSEPKDNAQSTQNGKTATDPGIKKKPFTAEQAKLWAKLLEAYGNNQKLIEDNLYRLTTWTDKEKVTHPGKTSIYDISDKQAPVTRHLLEQEMKSKPKETKVGSDLCQDCNNMPTCEKEPNPNCVDFSEKV